MRYLLIISIPYEGEYLQDFDNEEDLLQEIKTSYHHIDDMTVLVIDKFLDVYELAEKAGR
jgi:hypothetical protein